MSSTALLLEIWYYYSTYKCVPYC